MQSLLSFALSARKFIRSPSFFFSWPMLLTTTVTSTATIYTHTRGLHTPPSLHTAGDSTDSPFYTVVLRPQGADSRWAARTEGFIDQVYLLKRPFVSREFGLLLSCLTPLRWRRGGKASQLANSSLLLRVAVPLAESRPRYSAIAARMMRAHARMVGRSSAEASSASVCHTFGKLICT